MTAKQFSVALLSLPGCSGRVHVGQFFGEDELVALCEEMRTAERVSARVNNADVPKVLADIRKTSRVWVDPRWRQLVHNRLLDWMPQMASGFAVSLIRCQEPQFLAYTVGDFFMRHRDRATTLQDPRDARQRIVSVVILLNPGYYQGGVLALHEPCTPGSKLEITGRPGALVAFDSMVWHEVEPVTLGERYSIAAWYEGEASDG